MSRGARHLVAASLVMMSLAATAATPARKGASAAAGAPLQASAATAKNAPAAASAVAPGASAPAEFEGTLAAGATYVGEFVFDPRALKIWRPVVDVRPGRNVAWSINWTNLDQFPALKTAQTQARPQRFRFRVVKTDMLSGTPMLPWMATYHCELLAVEPVPAAPAPPPATRASAPRRR